MQNGISSRIPTSPKPNKPPITTEIPNPMNSVKMNGRYPVILNGPESPDRTRLSAHDSVPENVARRDLPP